MATSPTPAVTSVTTAEMTAIRGADLRLMAEVCHGSVCAEAPISVVAASSAPTATASYRRSVPGSSIVVRQAPIESGSYSASSRLQAAGLRPAIKLFEEAAAAVPLPAPPQPVVMAHYGPKTGTNSPCPGVW